MISPEDTAVFGPLPEFPSEAEISPEVETSSEVEASPEVISALEEYLAPLQQPEKKETKRDFNFYREIVVLVVGIIILIPITIHEFNSGSYLLGGFLAFCALFATAMVVCAFLPDNSSNKVRLSTVERLRESGEFDAVARDFPLEAQEADDKLRLGERYLFNGRLRTVHSYTQVKRLEIVKMSVIGGDSLTLRATYDDGKCETLYQSWITPEDCDRVATICLQIQNHNPSVQIS